MSTGRPRNRDRSQVRSERISVLVRPAVFDGLKLLANATGSSASDLLSKLAEALVENNAAVISKYSNAQREAAEAVDMSVRPFDMSPTDDKTA